ncbi:hypothetical protein IWQ62_001457 [Dispira parvispora]|uniref:Uncharacterized protein n=1 Tax=Dispira parvispora TaxID=1520584 RepID=A0A9W8E3U5_9FUNG|nr:hypothetical protein IWQ62_001457 [Dispira parvispora]
MVEAFQSSLRTCLVGVIHVVVDVNLDDVLKVAKCQHLCEKLVVEFQIYQMPCPVNVIHMVVDFQTSLRTCSVGVVHKVVVDFQTSLRTCLVGVIHMVVDVNLDDVLTQNA